MKISSQLSDRLLWSSVQTFDRERLALVLVIPRLFFTRHHETVSTPQLLSCLLWNVLQCFNSWPNTYRNPIQSSWMNKCWDMFVSSCWDFNLTLSRCADGPALFRQQNPLYSVKRSFSLLGSVATNKAKIEDLKKHVCCQKYCRENVKMILWCHSYKSWNSNIGLSLAGRRVSTCNLISVISFVEILATKLI